jgi:hypothetical protein
MHLGRATRELIVLQRSSLEQLITHHSSLITHLWQVPCRVWSCGLSG